RAYSSPPIGIAITTSATISRINSNDVRLAKKPRPPDSSAGCAAPGGGVGIEIRVVRFSCAGGGGPGWCGRGLDGNPGCGGGACWCGGFGCCGGRLGGGAGCCGGRPGGR